MTSLPSYSQHEKKTSSQYPLKNTELRAIALEIAQKYTSMKRSKINDDNLDSRLLYSYIYNAAKPFLIWKYREFQEWENQGVLSKYNDFMWDVYKQLFDESNFLNHIKQFDKSDYNKRRYYKIFDDVLIEGAKILFIQITEYIASLHSNKRRRL